VSALKEKFTDPRIEWLGFTDAREFYAIDRRHDHFLVWPEPLSRTVIETFAAGNSAMCARSGGIPEIASLGKVVETYPAKDPRALAALMDRAMLDTDLWRSGGFRNANALNLFSDTSIATRYRAVYRGGMTNSALAESGREALEALVDA